MNLVVLNTNNLTELWTLGGMTAGQFYANDDYVVSLVHGSEWPNKLWFNHVPDERVMDEIFERWDMNDITVAVWGNDVQRKEEMLKLYGFQQKNELTGMSISLGAPFQLMNRLIVNKVDSEIKAKEWSDLFVHAFGYHIDSQTVINTMHQVDYYIGSFNGKPVGTAALYIDHLGVAGVHSMGIVPSQRRKGYAEELLLFLLNAAKLRGAENAMLQASAMGEGLYLKTGFNMDFQLKNFVINKTN